MTVTEKFKNDSAMAAIRALRGLETTAIMLETYAPEVFPEVTVVNGVEQRHFGRVMMESAAQSIRDAWALAIKEAENSGRCNQIVENERLREALKAHVAINAKLMREAGLDEQAVADSTSQARRALGECPCCKRMFKDGETCTMGGCPMGGDF